VSLTRLRASGTPWQPADRGTLALLRGRLARTYDRTPAEQVNAAVPIRDFVPLLVERLVRDDLGRPTPPWPEDGPKIDKGW